MPKTSEVQVENEAVHCLRQRAVVRRSLYERGSTDASRLDELGQFVEYKARDRHAGTKSGINVYLTMKLLYGRPFEIPKVNLARSLQSLAGNVIGGFHADLDQSPGSLDALMNDNIGEQWGALVNICRNTSNDNFFDAVFRLGLFSFSSRAEIEIVMALCAFARLEELKVLQPPDCAVFVDFDDEPSLTSRRLEELILAHLPVSEGASRTADNQTAHSRGWQQSKEGKVARNLAKHILSQWPCAEPLTDDFDNHSVDISQAMTKIQAEWTRVHNNLLLSEYLVSVQAVLDRHVTVADTPKPKLWRPPPETNDSSSDVTVVPSLTQELVLKQGPSILCAGDTCPVFPDNSLPLENEHAAKASETREIKELGQILRIFTGSSEPLWRQYGDDLLQSYTALRELGCQRQIPIIPELEAIDKSIAAARDMVLKYFTVISNAFSLREDRYRWLRQGNLWPRITPVSLLKLLRSTSKVAFGPGMKELLVSYGTYITNLQWLLRMKHAHRRRDQQKLLELCSDTGHSNWDPLQFPDWFLLEIESNFLIRREQVEVANAIITPPSSSNSVLQLNMGKGKLPS